MDWLGWSAAVAWSGYAVVNGLRLFWHIQECNERNRERKRKYYEAMRFHPYVRWKP